MTRKVYLEKMDCTGGDSVLHTIIYEFEYKQAMSLNGFYNRMVQEYLRCAKKGDTDGRSRCNWDRRGELGRDQLVAAGCEEIAHYSVWEFYDYIGYDYKNSTKRKVVWK